jgi:hypothetical protein
MNDKITLSLHDTSLKKRIKKYASDNGLTVSGIVEDYFKILVRSQGKKENEDFDLPKDLDELLEGVHLKEEFKKSSYKELRNKMYHGKVQK